MAKGTQNITGRIASLEARLTALESGKCCDSGAELTEDEKRKYASVPVGKIKRARLSKGLYICAQLHEIPYLKKEKLPHTVVTSWLENESGERAGSVTCSCTSGSCSVSKTCSTGNPSCDCVNCTLSCS